VCILFISPLNTLLLRLKLTIKISGLLKRRQAAKTTVTATTAATAVTMTHLHSPVMCSR
jgi:hypothetical protein